MIKRWAGAAAAMGLAMMATTDPVRAADGASDAQIIELRQYKLAPGMRDAFVALFEDKFVESQEALGIRLVGQFRDHDAADRFIWVRGFRDMEARETALNAFYFGPVWQANRDRANPMLVDNDNVLLLRPAAPGLGFGTAVPRDGVAVAGALCAVIEYLWKAPDEGFATFFAEHMAPALADAGVEVVAAYVPLDAPNNFPQLPVRDERKLLVWFVRGASHVAVERALERARGSARWRAEVAAPLANAEERAPQILRLDPTPRSALR